MLNGMGENISDHHGVAALEADAAIDYGETYEALWVVLGDEWFGLGKHRCVIREHGGWQTLTIEELTPYSLRVVYNGAAVGRWSVDLTHEDADGCGGYDVCSVASSTGHGVDALNERLQALHRLASDGNARVTRD